LAWEPPDGFRQPRSGVAAFVLQTLGVCVLQGFTLAWTSVPLCWLVILVFSVFVAVRARGRIIGRGC
jgi:hypothetical protein